MGRISANANNILTKDGKSNVSPEKDSPWGTDAFFGFCGRERSDDRKYVCCSQATKRKVPKKGFIL